VSRAATSAAAAADVASRDLSAWQALLEALPLAAWVVSLAQCEVVAANAAAARLLGLPAESLVGQAPLALASSPEDLAWWDGAQGGQLAPLISDSVIGRGDGSLLHVTRSIRVLKPASDAKLLNSDRPMHALVTLVDRSASVQADDARESLLCELQATLEATADGILVTDLQGQVKSFNRRFAEIWSVPPEIMVRHDGAAVLHWMRKALLQPAALDVAEGSQPHRNAVSEQLQLHDGKLVESVCRPLSRSGRLQGRVWSFRDLSERQAAQQQIEALRSHDPLTGLPNRRSWSEHVGSALADLRPGVPGFAVMLVDLDRFRQLNDSLGLKSGDAVLLELARRMAACLRQGDYMARLGGDQFAVWMQLSGGQGQAHSAGASARRIIRAVAEPCQVDGAPFTVTCSIGLALAPAHGNTADELLRHAQAAMREAKAAGRADFRLHRVRREVDGRAQLQMDHAMRQALVSNRFRLHYQPQVSLADGQIAGVEALLRWHDPILGEVAPARFIPVAEESGFVVALGDWVLSQAIRQGTMWHQRARSTPIAVNVSALQFQQPDFVERLAGMLAVSGLPPELLELELTESILLQDAEEALLRLHALTALGVQLSIDDFGTGYSSLAYLKRLPIRKLKIDRSFIAGLPEQSIDVGIVRAILQMARALQMRVIAEGVETEAQRLFLQRAGCDLYQGFLFAPGLEAVRLEAEFFERRPVWARRPSPGRIPIRLVRG